MSSPPDLAARRLELLTGFEVPGKPGLFFDLDGTLAPIMPDPASVTVSEGMRRALEALSTHVEVAVLTGRDVATARRLVGLDQITYAGNHGVEWWWDGSWSVLAETEPFIGNVHAIAGMAAEHLAGISGIVVEDKGISASIHYRGTADPGGARAAIDRLLDGSPDAEALERREGKMVVELRPPVQADKGTALTRIVEERGLSYALMFGDDLTDADAFRALRRVRDGSALTGSNVVVLAGGTPESLIELADYSLADPAAVEGTLTWLAGELDARRG